MSSDDNTNLMASVLSKYNEMSSIPTPQSSEADFSQFYDVDDENIVNQKKDMNTGSNVNDDGDNDNDDGDNDNDDMLDLDDDMLDDDTNANDQDVLGLEFEFESEVEVENTLTDVFKTSIEGFGMDATKVILLNACKIAGIELYRTKDRESSSKIQELKVAEIRQKVTGFTHATLDSTIVLKAMDTRANLLDNIQAVNIRIVGSEAAREIAQVRVFGYLYHMHINIEAARQQSDFKGFLMELRTVVGLKSSPAVSKFRRRCKRVAQLVDVVGNQAGAFVLGLYITIYSLENDMEEAWKLLLKDIKAQRQFLEFTKSLQLASDQVTPIFARNEQ